MFLYFDFLIYENSMSKSNDFLGHIQNSTQTQAFLAEVKIHEIAISCNGATGFFSCVQNA